jgi:CRP/FNR family cyclic AMP-dependent transcriptional regulator
MRIMLERALPSLTAADVAAIEARCMKRAFTSGGTVIKEGDVVDGLMMICSGKVRVMRNYLDDLTAEFTGPLGPGDLLGEISFIDGTGASAGVVADGDVEVLVIPHSAVDALIAEDAAFAGRFYHSILVVLCRRLRRTNMRVLPPGA